MIFEAEKIDQKYKNDHRRLLIARYLNCEEALKAINLPPDITFTKFCIMVDKIYNHAAAVFKQHKEQENDKL
jgi:hypothetical protein